MTSEDIRHVVVRLARAHGLAAESVAELRATGTINRVFVVDDRFIVRVPHDSPKALRSTLCELAGAPIGIAAGLRTPRLLVADSSKSIVTVPFTIYERAPGITASMFDGDIAAETAFWRDVGAESALLHARVTSWDDPNGWLETPVREDPRGLPAELARAHYFSVEQARWFDAWIARLERALDASSDTRFLHADLHAANLTIDPETRRLASILDWGDAGPGDPTLELRCVPLRAIEATVDGYESAGGILDRERLGGLVLWDHLVLVLSRIKNPPQEAGPRWLSEPATALVELARFAFDAPALFREWLPPRRGS